MNTVVPIPGHPGYGITAAGEVWSFKRAEPYLKRASKSTYGYPQISLSHGRENCRRHPLHVLMALTFLGPRPPGMHIRHLDGDPSNNRLENLTYGTVSENQRDSVAHGTHYHATRTHCPRGHAYDEANTHTNDLGHRWCLACRKARNNRAAPSTAH